MYCTQFDLFKVTYDPTFLTELYHQIAAHYELPSVDTLLVSTKHEVVWNRTKENGLEVYYLDNLMEVSTKDVFEVRFKYAPDARAKVALFLSFERGKNTVLSMSLTFPGKAGIRTFSRILGYVKELQQRRGTRTEWVSVEIQGFTERPYSAEPYIRERNSFSGFVWDEGDRRYLHVSEIDNHPNVTQRRRK